MKAPKIFFSKGPFKQIGLIVTFVRDCDYSVFGCKVHITVFLYHWELRIRIGK